LNWFKTTLEFSGYPLRKAQKHLELIEKNADQDLEAYVNQQKWAIVDYHLSNNSYYKAFCKNQRVNTWENVPVLDKSDLQIPLQHRLSKGYALTNVFKNSTSGSSGQPFRFAKDKYAHALTWANICSLYKQYGIDLGHSLEARFYGIPKSGLANKKERLKDKLSHRVRFDVFDLSDKNLAQFLNLFSNHKFEFINGYTSSIVRFAKYLKSKQIVLQQVCPTLKICITTSEMLFETDRALLETQLGIPIVNEYGAAELGVVAFENSNSMWELNCKTLFVEIVDDEGNPLGYDKEGHIVITSLYNKAHPFIRYKIGDKGSITKDEHSGKPVLKALTGRTNEFAYLQSGKVVPSLAFYYVTKTAVEKEGDLKELVVEQKDKNTFKISYVATEELNSIQKKKIQTAIETYLEPGLQINFIKTDRIDRTKSGKLKQFVSEVTEK